MPRRAWGLIGCLLLAAWMLLAPTIGGAVPDRGLRLAQPTTPGLPPTPTNTPPVSETDTPPALETDTPLIPPTDTPLIPPTDTPVPPTETPGKPKPAPKPSPTPTLTPTVTLTPSVVSPPPGDPEII